MTRILLATITLYQRTISPDHGVLKFLYPAGYCRFSPSCSQYVYEAIRQYGVWRGVLLATRRLLRCHPWNKGGFDPVPRQ